MEQETVHVHFIPNVSEGTVSPSIPQYGGVQGDRNATLLSFFVPETLRGDRFRYHMEGEDGAGGFICTEPLPIDDENCVAVLLDERFTAAGGQILVRLVVSEVQDDNEISVVRSFDGRLFFADAPQQNVSSGFRDSLSAMVVRTDEKLAQMEETRETVTEQVGAFNVRVAASEGMLMSHESRLTAAESRLTADEQEADTLDTWVEEISNNLSQFKSEAETKESEPTPWKFIQKIVRAGLAKKVFSVGDVLRGTHSDYGTIEWEVIGFDHETMVASDLYTHSMTLQAKNALHRADGAYDLKVYDASDATYAHGNAEWETSDLRTWLNSKETAGHWGAYGENDTPPEYYAQDGFMRGLSESFLNAIGTVKTTVSQNSTHSGLTTTYDTFFLPGRAEVYGGSFNNGTAEGAVYEGYGAEHSSLTSPGMAADTNRVKKVNGSASTWWLRSVNPMTSDKTMQVRADGGLNTVLPDTACAVAPVCCIY